MGRASKARGEGLPGRGVTVTTGEVLLLLTASLESRVTLTLDSSVLNGLSHQPLHLQPVHEKRSEVTCPKSELPGATARMQPWAPCSSQGLSAHNGVWLPHVWGTTSSKRQKPLIPHLDSGNACCVALFVFSRGCWVGGQGEGQQHAGG